VHEAAVVVFGDQPIIWFFALPARRPPVKVPLTDAPETPQAGAPGPVTEHARAQSAARRRQIRLVRGDLGDAAGRRERFPHVDQKVIDDLITDIERAPPRGSPFQAYRSIRNKLRSEYPPKVEAVSLDGTNISKAEAQWYFISNFKTYAEVVVDGNVMSFVNTPDDNHAEDNMMAALDKYVEEQR
jgi:hypothetical protein